MNRFLLIIILIFSVKYSFTQLNCDDFNPNTFQHTTSHWDWRDDTQPWDAYIGTGATSPTQWAIWSPFRSGLGNVNQLNTKHLYTQISELDYAPEEGWELIKKNFGTNTAGGGIDHPYFILYNRFRSVMRIFVCATPVNGLANPTSARIIINWESKKEVLYLKQEVV